VILLPKFAAYEIYIDLFLFSIPEAILGWMPPVEFKPSS